MITRIAPTPSGFLHQGNALNFLLIDLIKKKLKGKLVLRIDDFDRQRFRVDYAEDIFRALEKLQIEWEIGPSSVDDFLQNFSQQKLYSRYWDFLNLQMPKGSLYACRCSRSEMNSQEHHCQCDNKNYTYREGESAIKANFGTANSGQILWRRENIPSYHLVSIYHEVVDGISHVIRGEDLQDSTQLQRQLATIMGLKKFATIKFLHHPLLLDESGIKLSKSVLGQKTATGQRDWDVSSLRSVASTMFEKLI
jgi:glutamyl/glutaminyl-tRNA synthetase